MTKQQNQGVTAEKAAPFIGGAGIAALILAFLIPIDSLKFAGWKAAFYGATMDYGGAAKAHMESARLIMSQTYVLGTGPDTVIPPSAEAITLKLLLAIVGTALLIGWFAVRRKRPAAD